MIHRNRVQKPPFERLRSLCTGAVGMPPEPPEMLPVSLPRHAVGIVVAELEDMEAAVHAARARAACNSARRRLRDIGATFREMQSAESHLRYDEAQKLSADVMSMIARREALR